MYRKQNLENIDSNLPKNDYKTFKDRKIIHIKCAKGNHYSINSSMSL